MVDSAVILDNIKLSLTNLYEHLKKYKIDICLNNVIFKWLVTLFFENTDESIYTPVMDSLILYGDITLYKASISFSVINVFTKEIKTFRLILFSTK